MSKQSSVGRPRHKALGGRAAAESRVTADARAGRPADTATRAAALDEAARAAADFGAANDLVDDAAAAVLGVNRTDLRILGLVLDAGMISAAPLAAAAELSPAALSTAIQRLVAAGHLTRATDDADRRRAAVTVTPSAAALLSDLYGPIEKAGHQELAHYSEAELGLITGFLRRGYDLQHAQADRIRRMKR